MKENLKKLQEEKDELQKHLDNLQEKINEMKDEPKFKAGRYYKAGKLVVYATDKESNDDEFAGIVVQTGCWPIGHESNSWNKDVFHEVTPEWREV